MQQSSWIIRINILIIEDNESNVFVGLTHFADVDPGAQRAKFSA